MYMLHYLSAEVQTGVSFLSQVQTNGECEPKAAMQDALQDLQNEFGEIAASFAVSAALRCHHSLSSRAALKSYAVIGPGMQHNNLCHE